MILNCFILFKSQRIDGFSTKSQEEYKEKMTNYTPEQKQRLVSKLQMNLDKRISKLRHDQCKIIASLHYKSQSRLHSVPKKYWNLKIRDVLELERTSRITFATLLKQLVSENQSTVGTKQEATSNLKISEKPT